MARVYVKLLYAGKRTWEVIPDNLKEEVKTLLIDDVNRGVITSEYFNTLTGETFSK